MAKKHLLDTIFQAMKEDQDGGESEADRLWEIYQDASHTEKAAINSTLMCICGYSLSTLKHVTDGGSFETAPQDYPNWWDDHIKLLLEAVDVSNDPII